MSEAGDPKLSQGVSEKCRCFCCGEARRDGAPLEKALLYAFDLPGLGLDPSERAEKGRCGPEKRGLRRGGLPSTPPPVEPVVEGDPSDISPVDFQVRSQYTCAEAFGP